MHRSIRRFSCVVLLVLALAVGQQASRSTGIAKANGINGETSRRQPPMITGGCDNTLWEHVYHPGRLQVHSVCTAVTGMIVDATHGKRKSGVRKESDGDCHGWIRLDPGQEQFLNAGNLSDEEGNLVYEIVCLFPVKQADAIAACQGFKSPVQLVPVGSHVKMTGSWVMDDNHARWNEIHPVSSTEIIPQEVHVH